MATAREILFQTWLIQIGPQGSPSQPDQPIANGDYIEFQNNANFSVSITFTDTSGTVFNDIPVLAGNGTRSQAQQAQMNNVTVNYTITNLNANQDYGPYGIQVATGPMQINISGGQPDPLTISIPSGGQIAFDNEDGTSYPIQWSPSGLFNPNVNPIASGLNPTQTAARGNQTKTATYTLTVSDNSNVTGTVHINS